MVTHEPSGEVEGCIVVITGVHTPPTSWLLPTPKAWHTPPPGAPVHALVSYVQLAEQVSVPPLNEGEYVWQVAPFKSMPSPLVSSHCSPVSATSFRLQEPFKPQPESWQLLQLYDWPGIVQIRPAGSVGSSHCSPGSMTPSLSHVVPPPPPPGVQGEVNHISLLLTPPTVTAIGYPPSLGKIGAAAAIAVSLHEETAAVSVLNVSELVPWLAPNRSPVIATDWPEGPHVGLRKHMPGPKGPVVTMKFSLFDALSAEVNTCTG